MFSTVHIFIFYIISKHVTNTIRKLFPTWGRNVDVARPSSASDVLLEQIGLHFPDYSSKICSRKTAIVIASPYFPDNPTGIRPYDYCDCKRLTHRRRAIFHAHSGITTLPFTWNVRY